MLRINRRTAGGAQVRGLEAVLDGARQAVQRTDGASCGGPRIRGVGATARTRGIERHYCAESWIVALDPPQIAFQQFPAGNLTGTQPM